MYAKLESAFKWLNGDTCCSPDHIHFQFISLNTDHLVKHFCFSFSENIIPRARGFWHNIWVNQGTKVMQCEWGSRQVDGEHSGKLNSYQCKRTGCVRTGMVEHGGQKNRGPLHPAAGRHPGTEDTPHITQPGWERHLWLLTLVSLQGCLDVLSISVQWQNQPLLLCFKVQWTVCNPSHLCSFCISHAIQGWSPSFLPY